MNPVDEPGDAVVCQARRLHRAATRETVQPRPFLRRRIDSRLDPAGRPGAGDTNELSAVQACYVIMAKIKVEGTVVELDGDR